MPDSQGTIEAIAWGIGIVLVPALFYVVRWRLARHLQRQMMISADENWGPPEGERVPTTCQDLSIPQFAVHTADLVAHDDAQARRNHEARARQAFTTLCLFDLGAALGYWLLPWAFGFLGRQGLSSVGKLVGGALITLVMLRALVHRQQFRAFDLSRSRQRQRIYRLLVFALMLPVEILLAGVTPFRNIGNAAAFVKGLVSPRARTAVSFTLMGLAVVLGIVDSSQAWSEGSAIAHADSVGLLSAAALHSWALAAPRRHVADDPGVSLLVLRVFRIEASAAFIFSGLVTYWRHFGRHFAVVDPALITQKQRQRWWRNMATLLALYGALAFTAISLSRWAMAWMDRTLTLAEVIGLVITPALAGAWLTLAIGEYFITRRFIGNLDQLLTRLQRVDRSPRHLDLSFRYEHVPCHDNTWFIAVQAFLQRSRVVLMDLRGYSDARKGCRQEISLLFDILGSDRMLFLVATEREALSAQGMLIDHWKGQRGVSEHGRTSNPVLQLYVVQDGDERDMQAIIDLLLRLNAASATP